MKCILFCLGLLVHVSLVAAQIPGTAGNVEIVMSRDSARKFFGTYEFEPRFKMKIFSEGPKFFAQRIGDELKYQIYPKRANVFFLKDMPAELEFLKSARNGYDALVLHQGGKDVKAHRIVSQPIELYDTVKQLDSLLYNAYNSRDLQTFMAYFASNVEFYHDLTGLTDYQNNLALFKGNFTKPTIMRRVLKPNSLAVYPIENFGAIEIGTHRFFQTDPGQPERLVSEPKFIHIWQNTNGKWQLVRIVSYDH